MKTPIDVLRSLKRYTAQALPSDWEVRIDAEEGTFVRPSAIVTAVPSGAQMSGPVHATDYIQSFQVMCHPEIGGKPMDSLIIATNAAACLSAAFRQGVGDGRAWRVPLYDYEGVGADAASSARTPHDFARILDLNIANNQSQADERIYTVTAEVRLGWRGNSALPSTGREVSAIQTSFDYTTP